MFLESGDGGGSVIGEDFFGGASLVGGVAGESAALAGFVGAIDKYFERGEVAEFGIGESKMSLDDFWIGGLVDFCEGFGDIDRLGVVAIEEYFSIKVNGGGVGIIAAEKFIEVDGGCFEMFDEGICEGGFAGA